MNEEWRPRIISPTDMLVEKTLGQEDDDEMVFVTLDNFLRDGKLSDGDRRVFADMREGRHIPLPDELIEKLKERAHPEAEPVERPDLKLSPDEASFVRSVRIEERGSWRYVAERCSEQFGTDWGTNQIYGMRLCEAAAKFYGQDYLDPPWN